MPSFEEVKKVLEFYKEEEPSVFDKYMKIYEKEHPEIYKKLKKEFEGKRKKTTPSLDFFKNLPRKKSIAFLIIIAVVLGIYIIISNIPIKIRENTPPSIESISFPESLTLNSEIKPEIKITDKEENIQLVSLKYISPSKEEYQCDAEKKGDKWISCNISLNEGGIWKVYVSAKDVSETTSSSFEIYVPISETCGNDSDCGELLCKNKILINYSCLDKKCYSKKEIVKCCGDFDCTANKICNKTVFSCIEPPRKIICGDGYCDETENCGSCAKDCLLEGKVCCNNITYTGNCCGDENCGVGESCFNHVCQINTHGMIVKIVFNDTMLHRNSTAKWDSQTIKLWSDPAEIWDSQPSSGCRNDSNLKAVYQAISSLYLINKLNNLTSNDKTNIAGWVLDKYENGEFKDCFGSWYKDEIKTFYALKILNYTGYIGLVSEYEDNITISLYSKAEQGFNELPDMCRYDFDDSKVKVDYSRQISIYLQVKKMFNKTISEQEKFDVINALKCSFKLDGTWINMENIYWVLESLNIVNSLETININKTIDWIESCQYKDGHFGKDQYVSFVDGNWYAIKSLQILNATNKINKNLALDWTISRILRNWTSFEEKYNLTDVNIDKTHEDLKLRFYTVDSYFMLK